MLTYHWAMFLDSMNGHAIAILNHQIDQLKIDSILINQQYKYKRRYFTS